MEINESVQSTSEKKKTDLISAIIDKEIDRETIRVTIVPINSKFKDKCKETFFCKQIQNT